MKQLGVLLFLLLSLSLSSQNVKRFKHLTINEGLAHTDAICFDQDEKGFIWIGTNSGLDRYDGVQFTNFKNDVHILQKVYTNRILSLCNSGTKLWVGTEGGLQLFDLEKEKFTLFRIIGNSDLVTQSNITSVQVVKNYLFILTPGGLFVGKYNERENTLNVNRISDLVKNYPSNLKDEIVQRITNNGKSKLWIGFHNCILSFNVTDDEIIFESSIGETGTIIQLAFGFLNDLVYWDNRLWISKGESVQIISLSNDNNQIRNSLKTIKVSDVLLNVDLPEYFSISRLLIDNYENLWGTTTKGLFLLEDPLSEQAKGELFQHSEFDPLSLSVNHLNNLYRDNTNSLWIGSWGGGISLLNLEQKKFNLLLKDSNNKRASLSDSFVRAIDEDDSGLIWIGTKNKGIDVFNPQNGIVKPMYSYFGMKDRLNSEKIRSLKIGKEKAYVGTSSGLNIIDRKSFKIKKIISSTNNSGMPNAAIYALEIDKYGQVWCGTWGGGIVVLRNNLKKEGILSITQETIPSLSSNIVTNLFFDERKNEVLACTNKGLNKIILDHKGNVDEIVYYREYDGEGSLTSEYLWPLIKENDSMYWVGTFGGGLNKIQLTKEVSDSHTGKYCASSYFPVNGDVWDIESLLEDNNGNLWLGGRGLSRFDKKTGEFWQFDVNDGLQSNGFKIGSALKAKDGTFYFGGINGLNFFNPNDIKKNEILSKVGLTRFKIQNQEILPGQKINGRIVLPVGLPYVQKINLTYQENNFSISFASMNYSNPEKCHYKYILEGYDEDWHVITGEYPVANYSNLEYGDYIFKVVASNDDGKFGSEMVSLKLHISPPWWLSFWAYTFYLVSFVLVLYSLYRYQSKMLTMKNNLKLVAAEEQKKEELHQFKLQFFTNISHEFKTPLTLILSPIERMLSNEVDVKEQKKLLTLVDKNAKSLLNLINELMDFRKAEVGKMQMKFRETNFKLLANEIIENFIPYCDQKRITVVQDCEKDIDVFLEVESVTKIMNNVIYNALKFTDECGEIHIKVEKGSLNQLKPEFKFSHTVSDDFRADEYAILRVRDTGVGISESSIKQVFDRFYHINEKTQLHLGTGIGLALVKSLVLLHKGIITISSERNVGTELLVAFPVGKEHINPDDIVANEEESYLIEDLLIEESELEKSQNLDEGEKKELSLLIVEDNVELRKFLTEHYKKDFSVLEAENGKQGVDLALQEIPDIIISDVMMPEMDGFELCKILKQDINTSHIPIVLLTAKSTMENQIEGTKIGADSYISKPFSTRLLDVKIEGLLNFNEVLKNKYASDVFASTRDIVKNRKDQKFLDQLITLIEDNIDNNEFTVAQLCKELGLGRTNLYKKVKSLTGQSLGQFSLTLKLKKAAKILVSEDVSITEVIYRVGINSNSYFTKAFKAQFGVTPSEYIIQKSRGGDKA